MGLFDFIKNKLAPKEEEPAPTAVIYRHAPEKTATQAPAKDEKADKTYETVRGTGMEHRMENVMKLAVYNPNYTMTKDQMIRKGIMVLREYSFPVKEWKLEEEPDNPVDPKAIKIIADGIHVAYVKAGSCSHVKKLIDSGKIKRITGEIFGGRSKRLYQLEEGQYQLDSDKNVKMHVSVNVKLHFE